MGKIITVTSGKGGAGKSTVSAGLGAAFDRRAKKVLLIDCDCGLRSLDLMVGASENTLFDLGDLLEGRCTLSDAVCPAKASSNGGLFLIPAPAKTGATDDRDSLARTVKEASEQYDIVILDSPAGIAADFISVVSCADEVIAVVNADPICIRDAGRVAAMLASLTRAPLKMLVNRTDVRRIKSGRFPNIDETINDTGIQLLGLIPEDERVPLSAAAGIPLRRGRAAAAFDRIAARIDGERVPLVKSRRL